MKFKAHIPIFSLCLFMICSGIPGLALEILAAEKAQEATTLISQPGLNLQWTYRYRLPEKTIAWSFAYEYEAPTDWEHRLKIQVLEDGLFESEPNDEDAWTFEENGRWRSDFSSNGQGVVNFVTSWDTKDLKVYFQIDQHFQDKTGLETVLANQLPTEIAGPHRLTLPELNAELKQSVSQKEHSGSVVESSRHSETASSLEDWQATRPSREQSDEQQIESEPEALEVADSLISGIQAMPDDNQTEAAQLLPKTFDSDQDPFSYEEFSDPPGWYPTHHSQQVLEGGDRIFEQVQNYQYASFDPQSGVDRYELLDSGKSTFDRGYHEFGQNPHEEGGRLNTKKTVRPLPGEEDGSGQKFEVILDTIGDTLASSAQVDLVLVIERSTRMTGTAEEDTWSQLQAATKLFVEEVFASELDIRVGLVGFSEESSGTLTAELGVAKYRSMRDEEKNNPENYRYDDFFADNPDAILKREILKIKPTTSSGAPTFLGVDAGLFLLGLSQAGREEATKVLCTITAGDGTYAPTMRYYQDSEQEGTLVSVKDSLKHCDFNGMTNTRKFFRCTQKEYFSGDGLASTVQDQVNAEQFYTSRQAQLTQVNWHTIQYPEEKAQATLATLGKTSFTQTTNQEELTNGLQKLVTLPQETVYQGNLTEHVSPYVTLSPGSVRVTTLQLTQAGILEVLAVPEEPEWKLLVTDDSKISLSNLTLGKKAGLRQGVRVTYEVQVNEDYRNGRFYPVSQQTFLETRTSGRAYYAQPSIRDGTPDPQPVSVSVFSRVKGSEDGIPGMRYGLFAQETGGEPLVISTISETTGQSYFPAVIPGVYWLREVQLPDAFLAGPPIEVTISNEGKLTGLAHDGNTIEKERKPLQVEFRQLVGEKLLSEGSFALAQGELQFPLVATSSGEFQIADLAPGKYSLVETATPIGFLPQENHGKIGLLEVSILGEVHFSTEGVTITSDTEKRKAILPALQRSLKEYHLSLWQTLEDNTATMETFHETVWELYDQSPIINPLALALAQGKSDSQGQLTFLKNDQVFLLAPEKTYYAKEISSPKEVLPLKAVLSFRISQVGQVTLEVAQGSMDKIKPCFIRKPAQSPNSLQLQIIRQPVQRLPDTGGSGSNSSWIPWILLMSGVAGCLVRELLDGRRRTV